jgi:hypothetical protein
VGVGIAAAWASAGGAPIADAFRGAAAPGDFATDFVVAARLWSNQSVIVDVATGNADAARMGAPPYAAHGVPFGAHPPPATMVVAALVPLGFRGAAAAWLALSLMGLAVVAAAIARTAAAASNESRRAEAASPPQPIAGD